MSVGSDTCRSELTRVGYARPVAATTDFTTFTYRQLRDEFRLLAGEATRSFGSLDEAQLNWRPADAEWSVGQCLDHLMKSNRDMLLAMEAATAQNARPSIWQRLPWLPRWFGRMLVRSLSPTVKRKFKTSLSTQPSPERLGASTIARFVDQQDELIRSMDETERQGTGHLVMASPFAKFIAYSLLDGWRIIVTHEWRHLEQARRVMDAPGFPGSSPRSPSTLRDRAAWRNR